MKFRQQIGLSYDDVLLAPWRGIVDSRSDVDLSSFLTKKLDITIPIVSAPMSTVTEGLLAIKLSDIGGAAFIHRFMSKEDQQECWGCVNNENVGCAIGLEKDRFKSLWEAGCRLFCLDVAHAHSDKVFRFLNNLDGAWEEGMQMIVGSVATEDAIGFFYPLPVAAFRVGIGPGAACTTRQETGFGVPQLTAIMECAESTDIPIIADGGIKSSGDIVKALAAGASSVMLGRLLAGAKEAPHPGLYWGEASEKANGGSNPHIEGVSGTVEIEGTVKEIVDRLLAGVRSGISYGGASNIKELQQNAEFIPVANAVHIESGVRI